MRTADINVRRLSTLEPLHKETVSWADRALEVTDINDERFEQLRELFADGILLLETVGVLANLIFENSQACRRYLRSRYKYVFIDEYQDSGASQHKMFLDLIGLGIIGVAVGDVNQSIYAFSGKSARYLSELLDTGVFKPFPLTVNHRCHPSIINYSNRFLGSSANLLETDEVRVFYKRVTGNEEIVAAWIERSVPRAVERFKPESLSSIAVLTRSNLTAELLNEHLTIPRNLTVSTRLDDSYLIWSQLFSKLLFYAFNRNRHLIDVVNEFTTFESLRYNERKILREFRTTIRTLFADGIDVEAIIEIFATIATIAAPKFRSDESIFLLRDVLIDPLKLQSYAPTALDHINIMTIHKSKGLQFDVVYHLDLHEWILPAEGIRGNERFYRDWEQDLNTHYVGLTRAKDACILVTSTRRTNSARETKQASDSVFLDRIELKKLRID